MVNRHARGFSYLGLLFAVAVLGLAAAASVRAGALMQRRAAEDELLFIGREFRNALRHYREATPDGGPPTPHRLEDLLADPRFADRRRHLRRIYTDPLTGRAEWGLVRDRSGTLLAVFSLAEGEPIRRANFHADFFHFGGARSYRGWVFAYGVACTDTGCQWPAGAVWSPP